MESKRVLFVAHLCCVREMNMKHKNYIEILVHFQDEE